MLIGLSTRALAESAVKHCRNVVTLDYFGDQDQRAQVENFSLAREYRLPFSAANLLKASQDLTFDTVAYTANFENHPNIVAALSDRASLAGNGAETVRRIRDWSVLREFCEKRKIPHPQTLLPGEERLATNGQKWLCKPVNQGGGHSIRPWDGRPLNDSSILQSYMDGMSASATFLADGQRCKIIGLTRQLIGRSELGGSGYTWCGNILPLGLNAHKTKTLLEAVENMVSKLTQNFGLKGFGGMDFIISEGVDGKLYPSLLEINPRYTGSMELIESAYGLNIYTLHLDACGGQLPDFNLLKHPNEKYYGKSIVYARKELNIQNTYDWAELGRKDIPFPNDSIKPGHPICTITAEADTYNTCLAKLITRADTLRLEIGDLKRDE